MFKQSKDLSQLIVLSEAIRNVIHDMNNHLTIVSGRNQFIKQQIDMDNPKISSILEASEKIETYSLKMMTILRNLRSIVKETQQEDIDEDWIRIDELVSFCVESVVKRFQPLKIKFENSNSLPYLEVFGKPTHLSQALIHLLSSAFESAEKSNGWAKLETAIVNNELRIVVNDSGVNDFDNLKQHMVRPFSVTHPEAMKRGLNLFIVERIVESHGGKVLFNETSANNQCLLVIPKCRIVDGNNHKHCA